MSSLDMVIALHGMGPNYPDLFQHEVGWPSLHCLRKKGFFFHCGIQVAWDSLADATGEFVVVYPLGDIEYLYLR